MDELTREEFERLKRNAAKELREIGNRQTAHPPFPDFVRVPTKPEQKRESEKEKRPTEGPPKVVKNKESKLGGFLKNINLPEVLKEKDSLLILGLILLLSSEEADESLIMALAYIMM